MTDEKITRFPGQADDTRTATDEAREQAPDPADDERARPSGEEEDSPLLREGADALDAADIEDPDEQL